LKINIRAGSLIYYMNVSILIFILVIAIFFTVRWGAAAVSHEIAMYHFHTWNKHAVQPDTNEWERTQKLIAGAIELDPANADYLNDQGRFYEYSADRMMQSQTMHVFLLIKAVDSFRLASQLRPAWPVSWANLAMVKSKLGTIDDEFKLAIGNAMTHGKAYPAIYVPVTEAAISQWRFLSATLKAKVLYQIKVGLESSVKSDVLAIIRAHKMCLEIEGQGLSLGNQCYGQ